MNYRRYSNILIEAHKSIFFILPKNACSSAKAQIIDVLALGKGPKYPIDVHDPNIYDYPFVKTEELNNEYQAYLRFCIVRNPWDRLVSCYKDKIREIDYVMDGYINGVSVIFQEYGSRFYGGMPFNEFVEVVCNIPDAESEHHFSSQLFQILDDEGNLLVNYIGKFESLAEDLMEINRISGFPNNKFPHFRKTKAKDYQEYYTPELIELVGQRFQEDIDFFKYEFAKSSPINKIGAVGQALKDKLNQAHWFEAIIFEKNKMEKSNAEHKVKEVQHVTELNQERAEAKQTFRERIMKFFK